MKVGSSLISCILAASRRPRGPADSKGVESDRLGRVMKGRSECRPRPGPVLGELMRGVEAAMMVKKESL